MSDATQRREELKAVWEQASGCTKCPQLAATRQTVVFGAGNADADLMFVGEAPGRSEDEQGRPFVGRAGKLLEQLLGEVGFQREDVFINNTLNCLRYNAPVQLADGSWERIGRLVRSRYAGEVRSIDREGRVVPRQVTGWHATPLGGRSVFRLTYRNAERTGAHRVNIELTGDHPVLTERGYIPAAQLRADDRVATGQGLSALAFDAVCGSLLGDASIARKSACVTMSHAARQADYAAFKSELLAELNPRMQSAQMASAAGAEHRYDAVLVRTLAHRALSVLRGEFYRPEKVVPAWIESTLNARMLAIWFMDDGYMRIRPPRQPLAEIATNCFSDGDLQTLLKGIRRLGLSAKASRSRLYFDVGATRRLSECMAPYVPPSMRHKLHPEVEAAHPFEPTWLRPGPQVSLFDEVDVEDVTERRRGDTTFFCIDVNETHNFVTAGGVVHNCRPPDNRDPHPVEIENCQDYLMRKIELVEPRVICTLGNFATKLLRGDNAGITKVRGQAEVRVIGRRAVRLLPILHPAAALYTPANLAKLREDMAQLPDLLALPLPEQPEPDDSPREPLPDTGADEPPRATPEPEVLGDKRPPVRGDDQLGLF